MAYNERQFPNSHPIFRTDEWWAIFIVRPDIFLRGLNLIFRHGLRAGAVESALGGSGCALHGRTFSAM